MNRPHVEAASGESAALTRRRYSHSSFVLGCLLLLAAPLLGAVGGLENLAEDPATRGWRSFGEGALFQWNATNRNLEVTWDSSRPNSYFHRPLGHILTKHDDFGFSFDLRLDSILPGVNPKKPSTFQMAVGLMNFHAATNVAFRRGTGRHSPHLVEFDYFPGADFIAPTVSPALVSSNGQFATSFTYPLELTTGDDFHIALSYAASNRTLVTTMTRNGLAFGPISNVVVAASFTDFRVDTFAISSYNDEGDEFGSLLARGVVDNISLTLPPPPVSGMTLRLTNLQAQVEFLGRTNWNYFLERSEDLESWNEVSPALPGVAGTLTLPDTNAPGTGPWFYRVRAERP